MAADVTVLRLMRGTQPWLRGSRCETLRKHLVELDGRDAAFGEDGAGVFEIEREAFLVAVVERQAIVVAGGPAMKLAQSMTSKSPNKDVMVLISPERRAGGGY